MGRARSLWERAERPVAVVGQVVAGLAAVAALVLSIISIQVASRPADEARQTRDDAIRAVLDGVVSGSVDDIDRARSAVAAGSAADDVLWFLSEVRELSPPKSRLNSIASLPAGAHELCLPGYRVLWDDCLAFSEFTFDDSGAITGWSIDGIPLRALFERREEPVLDLADETRDVVNGMIASLQHPRSDRTTYLFRLERTLSDVDLERVRIVDLRFEDRDEAETVGVQVGPLHLDRFDVAHWAVVIPDGGFVGFAYEGVDAEGTLLFDDGYGWLFGR